MFPTSDLKKSMFPTFFEIGRLLFLKSDFNVRLDFNVQFQIGRLILGDIRFRIGGVNKTREADNCTSCGDVQFEIARLRRPISRKKMGNESSDAPSAGALVRPLWRAAAPRLKPLRLPRAQLQVIFRKRATNCMALL